jgi:Cof subfamily protein (haloacid dehalogenase superfamily)
MVEAIVVDIDGTLLNSKKTISRKTGELLMRYTAKGIKIILATARSPISLDQLRSGNPGYAALLELPDGVFYNGGCVKIQSRKRYFTMNPDSARKVSHSVPADISNLVNVALQHENEMHSLQYNISDEEKVVWGLTESRIMSFEKGLATPTVKIIVYLAEPRSHDLAQQTTQFPNAVLRSFHEMYIRLSRDTTCQTYLSDGGTMIQIVNKSVNKRKGTKEVLSVYGISHASTAYFGDDKNDVECLKYFANSFAMGNADDEIKNESKYVTSSNDEDGIYRALVELEKRAT